MKNLNSQIAQTSIYNSSCNSVVKYWIECLFSNLKAHSLRSETIFDNCKPFKNDELIKIDKKWFSFHLNSSFRSQDI